ncbi:MAG: PASTA domain-containing protein [Candidatus Eisenbacteria sp.]|nr:PASTA domain-containing protein [Candidatus Eisenbacteria bacterium]
MSAAGRADTADVTGGAGMDESAPRLPRFARTDRFATSCSALSALCQLEQLGVKLSDIRLVLEDCRRRPRPQVLAQEPAPGESIRHGREVRLWLARRGIADLFPEGLFVSLPGQEGRDQLTAARRLFSPFDREHLLALSHLRYWNAVFSGGHRSEGFDAFLFRVLGLGEDAIRRARRVFDPESLRAWTRMLPLLPRLVGDPSRVAAVIGRLLNERVAIEDGRSQSRATPAGQRLRLARAGRAARRGGFVAGLGQAVAGREEQPAGSAVRVRIGPLTPERALPFRGLSFDAGGPVEGGAVINLGPVCEFERYWQRWEQTTSGEVEEPIYATRWPRLVYLLEHLMPAPVAIEVHLLPKREPWRLGARQTAPSAAGAYQASTLGAYTALSTRSASTG